MKENHIPNTYGRRSFLKGLALTGVSLAPASALLSSKVLADAGDRSGSLTKGDAAILRWLATAEIIESDFWEQYWELGGTQTNEFAPPTGGNALLYGRARNFRQRYVAIYH
jgi:hypothetical protein